jgi:cell division protein FtsX
MNRDYLQDALHSFNLNTPNWYGWRTHDDNGNKIPNDQRMCWEHTIVIKDGAVKPTKQEVENKIQEIKNEEQAKIDNKQSALNKLKALGLNDAEIKAITGI